jgi:exoribonuclease R
VRSRQALSYPDAQSALDGASPPLVLALLREVGERRQQRERERGGVNLDLPDQEVDAVDGGYRLAYRTPLPVEGWNAQISLLAGMEAARLMVAAGVGVLRTLPPPDDHTLKAIRRSARALGHPWPDGRSWPEFLRSVDRSSGSGAALLTHAARAFRGAGYVTFTAGAPAGPAGLHAGVAAAYAHVTAPLRRLGDRVANEIVVALCAGIEPPGWAVQALDELPLVMDHASQRDNTLHRAIIDYVEAMVLRSRVGDTFDVTVTNIDHRGAVVQLSDPAVLARLPADGLRLGEEVTVRLVAADPATRRLEFALVR